MQFQIVTERVYLQNSDSGFANGIKVFQRSSAPLSNISSEEA